MSFIKKNLKISIIEEKMMKKKEKLCNLSQTFDFSFIKL